MGLEGAIDLVLAFLPGLDTINSAQYFYGEIAPVHVGWAKLLLDKDLKKNKNWQTAITAGAS